MPKLSNECCKAQKLFLDYLQTCIYFIEEPFNSIGTVFGHSKITVTFIFSAIYLLTVSYTHLTLPTKLEV